MIPRLLPVVPALLFVCVAIMFGGASTQGPYANAAIQMVAALGIALAVSTRQTYPGGTQTGLVLLLCAALALPLVQLVPLPVSLWTVLPGRDLVVESLRLAGIAPAPAPLSLVPQATIGAALAIVPVIAAALIGMRAPRTGVTLLFIAIVVLAVISVLVGIAQHRGGLESTWYFYRITNRGYAVGFFANSNHLATLCAATIPAATALFVARRGSTRVGANWLVLLAIVLVVLSGIWLSRSEAGVGLSAIGLLSIVAIARLRRGSSAVRMGVMAVIAMAVAGIAAVVGMIIWAQVAESASIAGGEMGRPQLWRHTIEGVTAFFPLGSGMGSFPTVYPQFETLATVTRVYANHAHNDYLEALMDGGVPAAVLMIGFVAWWLRTTILIWRAPTRDAFAEAATVVTAIIMTHELVDYPLRTAAIAVIFGLCCGVMARPRRIVEPEERPERASRHVAV